MGRLLFFLGGTAVGLLAPKVVSLVRDLLEEELQEVSDDDIKSEIETASADPDAVIIPVTDDNVSPGAQARDGANIDSNLSADPA
jgi:hypothetical protein